MAKTVETLAVKMVLDATGVTDSIGATTKEINEAARIIGSTRTPLERLEEKERRLQELMAKGAVDDIPKFQRAMESLRRSKLDLANATDRQSAADAKSVVSQTQVIQKLSVLGDLVKFNLISRGVGYISNAFRDVASEVANAQKRIDEISERAARLGVTSQALQRLRIEANLSDVSFESLSNGMEKLFIKTADAAMGSRELQRTFAMLGLNAESLMKMDQAGQFDTVVSAIGQIADRGTRLSIIADLFGRGNTELIAFIENQAKLKEMVDGTGIILDERQVSQIGEADDAMKMFTHTVEGLFSLMAAELAPAITSILKDFTAFLNQKDKMAEFVTQLRGFAEVLKQFPAQASSVLSQTSAILDSLFGGSASRQGQEVGSEFARGNSVLARLAEEQRRAQEFQQLRQRLQNEGIEVNDVNVIPFASRLDAMKERVRQLDAERDAVERKREAERMAAEQSEQTFSTEREQLESQIELLKIGTDHIQQQKDAKAGYNAEQVDFLSGLREEKAALEAIKFAEEEDIKLKKERVSEAENIRQSLRSAEDAASDRLARAMDLVTTGELQQSDFDKMLEKEAAALSRGGRDVKLSATAFGSQAAIAATMGNQQSDSERLESIKQSLLELVKKPAVEVEEVGAI